MEIIHKFSCSRRNIKIQQLQGMAEPLQFSHFEIHAYIEMSSVTPKEVGVRFSWLADCLPRLRRIGNKQFSITLRHVHV